MLVRRAILLFSVAAGAACGSGGAAGGAGGNGIAGAAGGAAAGMTGGIAGAGLAGMFGSAGAAGGRSTGAGGSSTGGSPGTGGAGGSGGAAGTTSAGGGAGGQAVGGTGGGSGGAGGAVATAFNHTAVSAIMRLVADHEIASFGTDNDNGWVRAVFHTGMLRRTARLATRSTATTRCSGGRPNKWLLHSDSDGPRFADNQACVQSYAELYLADPSPENAVMIAAAQTTFDTMVAAPKAGRTEWWWCDALYMAPAAMARVAEATGKTEYVTLMNNMYWDTKAFLFDPAQSLFWRDSTFRNTNTYWSRGNGWVVARHRAHPCGAAGDGRPPRRLRDAAATNGHQAGERCSRATASGARASTQPNAYTNPESSGTAFFCFGIAWGINHGVLDRATFLPVVQKAWAALGTAVNAQGRLGWVQGVGSAPGPATADGTNDYAAGAFLLAGEQILGL